MTKHELVCATYVVASDQVRQLSGLIRIEFSKCSAAKAKASGRDPIEMEPCLFEHYQHSFIVKLEVDKHHDNHIIPQS